EAKGMTPEMAVKETERRLINYRTPVAAIGQRVDLQDVKGMYFNPDAFEFSRYHWGVMSRYAQLGKDLIDVRDPKRAFDALGSVMVLSVAQLVLFPALNAALRAATGN